MIIANITSYEGSIGAQHIYCTYTEISNTEIKKTCSGNYKNELTRLVSSQLEVESLNAKDRGSRWFIGKETNRFNTYSEVHTELLKLFPDQNIVSYKERELFSKMLCKVDGVNHGIDYFGEVFDVIPISFYKNLVDLETTIIKCGDCGIIHDIVDISEERIVTDHNGNDRELIRFNNHIRCCRDSYIIWNKTL